MPQCHRRVCLWLEIKRPHCVTLGRSWKCVAVKAKQLPVQVTIFPYFSNLRVLPCPAICCNLQHCNDSTASSTFLESSQYNTAKTRGHWLPIMSGSTGSQRRRCRLLNWTLLGKASLENLWAYVWKTSQSIAEKHVQSWGSTAWRKWWGISVCSEYIKDYQRMTYT